MKQINNDTFNNKGQKEKEKEYKKEKEKQKEIQKENSESVLDKKSEDNEKSYLENNKGTRYIGKYAKLYEQNIGLINGVAYEWLRRFLSLCLLLSMLII